MATYSVTTITGTLVASTPLSAIELRTPAGQWARVLKWSVEVTGTTAGQVITIDAATFSAAVTTNTSVTPLLVDRGVGGIAAVTAAGVNATAEGAGTATANAEKHQVVTTNSGLLMWESDKTAQLIPASSFWRLRLNPPGTITACTAIVNVTFEE